MRSLGLHLRLIDNFFKIIDKAIQLQLPIFQCFLTQQTNGRLISLSNADIARFIALRRQHFGNLYIHISYHANTCDPQGIRILRRELAVAQRLEFTHAVLHPGSGKWCGDKQRGIEVLVSILNEVLEQEPQLTIMLENGAHGGFTVGGDIADFGIILRKVKRPDKLQFCIDTAHAYAYGYDMADNAVQDHFIAQLKNTMGIERIGLIHLNDTNKKLGNHIDQHEVIGQGLIGAAALQRFALHSELAHIPLILEPPQLTEEQEKDLYNRVKAWHE